MFAGRTACPSIFQNRNGTRAVYHTEYFVDEVRALLSLENTAAMITGSAHRSAFPWRLAIPFSVNTLKAPRASGALLGFDSHYVLLRKSRGALARLHLGALDAPRFRYDQLMKLGWFYLSKSHW
jgi:hypothetical protein